MMVVEYFGRCLVYYFFCCEGYEKVGNQCIGMYQFMKVEVNCFNQLYWFIFKFLFLIYFKMNNDFFCFYQNLILYE